MAISAAEALSRVQGNIVSTHGSEADKRRYINQYIADNGLSNLYNTGQFDYNQLGDAILSQLNNGAYADPDVYLQSAWDIANLNTMTSQALAREQMAFQKESNAIAMDFNASEAQKTRDWETLLANTSHQREVQDLIKAGLNPLLSANQGAATPAAANATGVTSSGAKGSVDTSMISAMVAAYQTSWQMKMQEKQLDTQLIMNALNNETTRYAADKGAYASVASAGMNSSAQRYAADINKMIYESGYHGIDSMAGSVINSILDGSWNILGQNNPDQAIRSLLLEKMPWASKIIDTLFPAQPAGRTSRSQNLPEGSGMRSTR